MVQRLLGLVVGYLLLAGGARAQAFEPGLLVRANGDTLRGEVENGFWEAPPTYIRYRRTPASPSELFQPRQLRAVSFVNGRYFRYEALPIDYAAVTHIADLPRGNATNVRVDSLLAEVLLDGPAMLLRVVPLGNPHYLVRRPGQPPLDLSERQYLHQDVTGAWMVMDGNDYHNQLTRYFSDCLPARAAAQTAAFTPVGLATVVQAYATSCTPGQQPARSWLAQAKPRRRGAF